MDGDAYGFSAGGRPASQEVLNAVPVPSNWHIASEPIDVTVRLVWELDGEERVRGHATRWTDSVVYVELDERRIRTTGVWVNASDVRRTAAAGTS